MEMRMFQRTWHGIDLTSLPAAMTVSDKPVSVEFYAQFYQALASGRGGIDPQWIKSKRQLGETIERDIIAPWQQKQRRSPRILALGSGSAPVEQVWLQHGHEVTFHDCQEDSLAETRLLYPQAGFLIGDIFQLVPQARYDLVTLITIDYVMNRREFGEFLSRAARWLEVGGRIIVYCGSTLSFRQMGVEMVKRCLGHYRDNRQVFWGYWRTPGEFFISAREAGLQVSDVFYLGGTLLRKAAPFRRRLPPWRNSHLIVTLESNR